MHLHIITNILKQSLSDIAIVKVFSSLSSQSPVGTAFDSFSWSISVKEFDYWAHKPY